MWEGSGFTSGDFPDGLTCACDPGMAEAEVARGIRTLLKCSCSLSVSWSNRKNKP